MGFEDELRYKTNPPLMAKCEREIERQRKSLASNWKEYDELKKQDVPAHIQNVVELLQQKETNLDAFQKLLLLNKFKSQSDRWRRGLFLLAFFSGIMVPITFFHDNPVYATLYLGASVIFVLYRLFLQQIPETLSALDDRGLIAAKSEKKLMGVKSKGEELESTDSQSNSDSLEKQYLKFISSFEKSLNHPKQWIFGIIIVIFFWLFPYSIEHNGVLGFILYLKDSAISLDILKNTHWIFDLIMSLIFGLMAWRMFITGLTVSQIEKEFNLTPMLDFHDGSGGFLPLGLLCLYNAAIIIIPGVFLAGWIVVLIEFNDTICNLSEIYCNAIPGLIPLLSISLLVPIVLAPIVFLLPLWNVHQAMKMDIINELNKLSKDINHLQRKMNNHYLEMSPEERKDNVERLKSMRQDCKRIRHQSTFPFGIRIKISVVLSYIVQILALISGFLKIILHV